MILNLGWVLVFIVIAFIDWRYHVISNYFTVGGCILAIVFLCVDSFTDTTFYTRLFIPSNSLISGVSCALVMGGIFSLGAYFDYGFMGMGDVKLVILIGLVLGYPLIVFAILFSAVAALVGIGILLKRGKTLKDMLPLGAFLSVGAIGALLLPDSLVRMVF